MTMDNSAFGLTLQRAIAQFGRRLRLKVEYAGEIWQFDWTFMLVLRLEKLR